VKYIFVLVLLILLSSCVGGGGTQVVEDQVDSFTGIKVKRTTFEKASNHYSMSPSMYNFIRFNKLDDLYNLDLKTTLLGGRVFAINKDDYLMIKLASGEIIKLKAIRYQISCKGCGAEGHFNSNSQGILQTYPISEDQLMKITDDPPSLLRVYLSDGYLEEAVPPDEAANLSKIARLILQ